MDWLTFIGLTLHCWPYFSVPDVGAWLKQTHRQALIDELLVNQHKKLDILCNITPTFRLRILFWSQLNLCCVRMSSIKQKRSKCLVSFQCWIFSLFVCNVRRWRLHYQPKKSCVPLSTVASASRSHRSGFGKKSFPVWPEDEPLPSHPLSTFLSVSNFFNIT